MLDQPFPSVDKIRDMYKDVFSNQAVTALSQWTDTNCSVATDEAAYLTKAMEVGDTVFDNIKRAAEGIGH
jgi:hypothetical protein